MVVQEIAIDRLASGKALVDAVPEANARFTHLPAEVNFLATEKGWEVDQSDVEILDDAPVLLNFLDRGFQALPVAVPLGAVLQNGCAIHYDAPLHGDSLGEGLQGFLGLLVLGLAGDRITDDGFYFGEQAFGFDQGKTFRHVRGRRPGPTSSGSAGRRIRPE